MTERKLMKDTGRDDFGKKAAAATSLTCPKHPDASKRLARGRIVCKLCGRPVGEDRTKSRRELMNSIVS